MFNNHYKNVKLERTAETWKAVLNFPHSHCIQFGDVDYRKPNYLCMTEILTDDLCILLL